MKKKGVWAVAVIFGALLFYGGPLPDNSPARKTIKQALGTEAHLPAPSKPAMRSPVSFTDVTAVTGIKYRHENGAFITKTGGNSRYLPETMGPGVVLFDYDGDGDPDIFVPNSSAFPGRKERTPPPTAHLYRNEGNFRFTDVTAEAGLDFTSYGMGAAAADYDGNGYPDLLVTAWGGVRLFRNLGNGKFEDATHKLKLF